MSRAPKRTLAFAAVGKVVVVTHAAAPPSDTEWDELVDLSLNLYQTRQFAQTLIWSNGGAPTAAQRHRLDVRLREVIAKTGKPGGRVAIMSRSPFVRAVVNASVLMEEGWFARMRRSFGHTPEESQVYRAFNPTEIQRALAWLNVLPEQETEIKSTLSKLIAEVT